MRAVAIFSGGLDSTTLLHYIMGQDYEIYGLSFDYHQRHLKELTYAKYWGEKMCEEHKIIKLDIEDVISHSALSDKSIKLPEEHYTHENQRITVVPNRNMVMLSIAIAYAENLGISEVFYAAHLSDRCFEGNTKVICEDEIKTIKELNIGNKVLSVDNNGNASWQKVINKFSQIPQKIIRITAKNGVSVCVTENHHMLRANATKVEADPFNGRYDFKGLEIVAASKLKIGEFIPVPYSEFEHNIPFLDNKIIDVLDYLKNYKAKRNSNQIHYDDKYIWFKKNNKHYRKITYKDFLKMASWWICEGVKGYVPKSDVSIKTESGLSHFSTYIYQSYDINMKNVDDILMYLRKLNINPHCEKCEGIFFSGPIVDVLYKLCQTGEEKHLPQKIIEKLSNETLQEILDILVKGDGCQDGKGKTFVQNRGILSKQVCYILTRLGYYYRISSQTDKCIDISWSESDNSGKKMPLKFNDIKLVRIKKIDRLGICNELYDVTVDNNHSLAVGDVGFMYTSQSIYPDCRKEYITALSLASQLGTYNNVEVKAPFVDMTKTEVVKLGLDLMVDFSKTWSCYKGEERPCLSCATDLERTEAFILNNTKDPLLTDEEWKKATANLTYAKKVFEALS